MGCEEFPARFDEVRLWGSRARRVVRVPPPPPLPRSFVSAVREGEMRRSPPRQRWEEQGPSKRRIEEDRRGGEFGRGFSSADGDRREGRFDADYPRDQVLRDRLVEERNFQREDWERRAPNNREANYNQRFDEFRTSDSEKLFRNGDQIGVGMQRNARIPTIHDRLGEGGSRNGADEGRDRGFAQDSRGVPRPKDFGTCRWCGQEGHHQATCTNDPLCFRCKKSGHIATQCPQHLGCKMRMFGFGVPGHGFYSLQLPEMKEPKPEENLGAIQIVSGKASVDWVEEELKHLIDNKWDWKVRQISDREFLAVFPNKTILGAFSKSNGIKLALHNIFAKVSRSNLDSEASSVLQTGWVKIYNIPPAARNEEAVKQIAELAGEVVVVDELSLIRDGPVRVKLNGREIHKLRGYIEVFFGKIGRELRFVAEGGSRGLSGGDQPPPKKPDVDSDEEEDDLGTDNDLELEK